jgi:hypothetical protein
MQKSKTKTEQVKVKLLSGPHGVLERGITLNPCWIKCPRKGCGSLNFFMSEIIMRFCECCGEPYFRDIRKVKKK